MTCRSQVRLLDVTVTVDKLMGQAMGKMGQARDPSPKTLFCLFADPSVMTWHSNSQSTLDWLWAPALTSHNTLMRVCPSTKCQHRFGKHLQGDLVRQSEPVASLSQSVSANRLSHQMVEQVRN